MRWGGSYCLQVIANKKIFKREMFSAWMSKRKTDDLSQKSAVRTMWWKKELLSHGRHTLCEACWKELHT